MNQKIHIENGVATIPGGVGYWDLTLYPWGGCFRRLADTVSAKVLQIVDEYSDKTPRRIIVQLPDRKAGFTC